MKKIFILLMILGSTVMLGQAVSIPLTVTDNSGGSLQLFFGLDPNATDGIDGALSENVLPPMPPAGVFDARFNLTATEASHKDYKLGNSDSFLSKIYELQYQVGNGTTITINWSLPLGVSGKLQDVVLGTIIDVNMAGSGSYTVANPGVFNKLKMTITYKLGAPNVPLLTSPSNNQLNTSNTPTLQWQDADNRETFHLQVSKQSDFSSFIVNDSALTDLSKQLAGLEVLTKYFWRVRAKNSTTGKPHSAFSVVWNFTTANLPPTKPILVGPVNNAVEIPLNTNLTWNKSDYAENYILQISTDTNFGTLVLHDSTLTDKLKQVGPLNPVTKYYWRVRAKNGVGKSGFSDTWNFTTELIPPAAPVLISPADKATEQDLSLALSWQTSPLAAAYNLIVSTDINFTTIFFHDSTITTLSQQISNLLPLTTYYWKVQAKNVKGKSAFTTIREFETKLIPPQAPVLVEPSNTSVNQSVKLICKWGAVNYADSYELQIATDENFTTSIITFPDIKLLSKQIEALEYGTKYYLRVRAKNSAGVSDFSPVWNFTTAELKWKLGISVANNGSETINLLLGTSILGSDGIDVQLNEEPLPPKPPQEVFDARFSLPITPLEFSYKDFRLDGQNSHNWLLKFQAGSSGYPLTLTWNPASIPQGSMVLKDTITGLIVNVNMKNQSSYVLSNTSINSLVVAYTKQICKNASLINGWNIFSIPVHAPDMAKTTLLPAATSPVYGFDNGYKTNNTLANGKGYWIKYPSSVLNICGLSLNSNSINANKGWNLIGVYETDVPLNNITTIPANNLDSPFYGYNNGYVTVKTGESVISGKGYWIKVKNDCIITWTLGASKSNNEFARNYEIDKNWTKLIVVDAKGKSGVLYLSKKSINTNNYELPPLPPNEIFDIRWSSQSSVETIINSPILEISTLDFPVKIIVEGSDIEIKDAINGQMYKKFVKDKESVTLDNPQLSKLQVISKEIPIEFGLEQNYPNPFNPTTKIKYAISERGIVKIILYNILGEKIEVLVNDLKDAGKYEIEWSAKNFPSGVYVYELASGKNRLVKKLILIK